MTDHHSLIELRFADDGQHYSQAEFVVFFGGLDEWHLAAPAGKREVLTGRISPPPSTPAAGTPKKDGKQLIDEEWAKMTHGQVAVQEPCTNAASAEGVEPPDDSELKELQQWEEEQDRIRAGMLAARRQASALEEVTKEDWTALPDHELEAYMNKLFCIADSNDDGVLDPAEFRKLMGMSILAFTDDVIQTVTAHCCCSL